MNCPFKENKEIPKECGTCKHIAACRGYRATKKFAKHICIMPLCDNPEYSRGLCKNHYQFVIRKQQSITISAEEKAKWQWDNLEKHLYAIPRYVVEREFEDITKGE